MQVCVDAEQFNDKAGIVYKSKLIVLPHVKTIIFCRQLYLHYIHLQLSFQSIFRAVTESIFLFLRSVCLSHSYHRNNGKDTIYMEIASVKGRSSYSLELSNG